MGRFEQKNNGHGSLLDIQKLINDYPDVINTELKKKMKLSTNEIISWVSPLKADNYAEYRDEEFIRLISDKKLNVTLDKFWPKNGPQWDGLGKTNKDRILLVEAKANIPEIFSSPLGATDKNSISLIQNSLNETKEYLNSKSSAEWTKYFYQYCNRLAHLYFLRVKNKLDAYLIFIYFVGDSSVEGPQTKEEWLGALKVMKLVLGIDKKHRINPYIIDLFIDVSNPNKFLVL